MSDFPIAPAKVQYVKLGDGGKWEQLCRSDGILRFGYETADPESMQLCREGRWEELIAQWQSARGNKAVGTRDVKETRAYWEDAGDTLWVTFVGDDLCWGFLEPGEPQPYAVETEDDFSTFRKVRGGWKSVDKNDERLGKYTLPGYVTKVSAYRRTVCNVEGAESLVARINGVKSAENERVYAAKEELTNALIPVLKKLQPVPFEILIEMIFARSGWRRVGSVGKAKRDTDISLEIPLTGERACVQVKTSATPQDLVNWIKFKEETSAYSRMFFVYHTSSAPLLVNDEEEIIKILGAHEVARQVVETGLTDWVINQIY